MMSPSIVNVDTSGCILTAPIDVHQITKVAPDLWLPPISWEDVGGGAKFPQLPRPKVWLINSTLLPSSASVGTNFDFFLWIEELKGVSTANIALYLYVPKKCAMLKRHEVGFTNDTTVVIYSDEFINRWPFCQPPVCIFFCLETHELMLITGRPNKISFKITIAHALFSFSMLLWFIMGMRDQNIKRFQFGVASSCNVFAGSLFLN